MLPVFSQPVGRGFRRSGASLLGVPQPVTDPFRAALMRVSSSSSFYPDFYGIKTSEKINCHWVLIDLILKLIMN